MQNVIPIITPSAEISDESPMEAGRTLPDFDAFWCLYPRHVAKLAARKAWAKVNPSQHVAILEALVSWRQVWRDKEPEYLPHGATWLNGERWEDELPAGFRKVTAESTQTGLKRDSSTTRSGPIPLHVQTVLNRLKAKL